MKNCNLKQEIKFNKNKLSVILMIFVLILFLSNSYALLTNFDKTDNVIIFKSGNLNMTINNVLISLDGKLPENDKSGLENSKPIVLTLTNTGTMDIQGYDVKLVEDENIVSTLDEIYIKYAISLDNGLTYLTPDLLTNDDNIIYTGYNLKVNESKTIYLKVWLDESSGNNPLNKEYYGSIVVDLYQKREKPDNQDGIYMTSINYKSNVDADLNKSKIEDYDLTTINSNIKLTDNPNSSITYQITIFNDTELEYEFEGITKDNYSNESIIYELKGLEKGDIISSKTNIIFDMTFKYKENVEQLINELISSLTFNFKEYSSNTLYKVIESLAVSDDIQSTNVNSSTGINFHNISSNTNGNGIYQLASTKNDKYPVYYYRGSVENNNLKFANLCWKIVRTTETGGIKIIYNGTPNVISGNCENISVNSQQINMKAFNESSTSLADVGYMYGTRYLSGEQSIGPNTYLYGNDVSWDGSSYTLKNTISTVFFGDGYNQIAEKYHYTCLNTSGKCTNVYYFYHFTDVMAYYITLEKGKIFSDAVNEMFSNFQSSFIKSSFDTFYSSNTSGLLNYTDKIENTIWCNDRSLYSGSLKDKDTSGKNPTYFNNYYKLINTSYYPDFKCNNLKDAFSLKVEKGGVDSYGNNLLDYSIGALTVDELILTGITTSNNASHYLNTGLYWWTLSPANFQNNIAYNYVVGQNGELLENIPVSYTNVGIRPVISLIPGIEYIKGTGILSDPYIVE